MKLSNHPRPLLKGTLNVPPRVSTEMGLASESRLNHDMFVLGPGQYTNGQTWSTKHSGLHLPRD